MSFHLRFMITQSNEDYEAAMAPLDKVITSHFPAKSHNQYLPEALSAAATLAHTRFTSLPTPEHLEEAISRARTHLISIPLEDPKRGNVIQFLEGLEATRLTNFGVTHALPQVHLSNPETISLPPFSHLTASLAEMNALESPSILMKEEDCLQHLDAIHTMKHITDGTDIDEAITYCRLLLASLQQRPIHPIPMTDLMILNSGSFLHHAFTLTKNPKYLDESIDAFRGMLKPPHTERSRFPAILSLLIIFRSRFALSQDRKDLDEIVKLSAVAATNTSQNVTIRFDVACKWANWAWFHDHPSTSTAFECAISLMQDALTFAPTLETQHSSCQDTQ
jgi:hypothetical protein